ncbi:uncharacterized protein LOC143662295 [Tamandua tetradactyla]|uniref:uncharacterized protein LOC143662295 n=1 Tax=Tamandua tetradactyla TaxID=48850 RepID=UPI0040546073
MRAPGPQASLGGREPEGAAGLALGFSSRRRRGRVGLGNCQHTKFHFVFYLLKLPRGQEKKQLYKEEERIWNSNRWRRAMLKSTGLDMQRLLALAVKTPKWIAKT